MRDTDATGSNCDSKESVEAAGDACASCPDVRKDADSFGVDGVGTAEAAPTACQTETDCPANSFCSFRDDQLLGCASPTVPWGRVVLASPGVCRANPCGTGVCLYQPCTSHTDCGPNGFCYPYGCGSAAILLELLDCSLDCPKVFPDSRNYQVCLCPSC